MRIFTAPLIACAMLAASAGNAATFTENFDSVPGWESGWFGANSNAQICYGVGQTRGNNPDGLWIASAATPGCNLQAVDVSFTAGFAASLTSLAFDVAAYSPTNLTFYDKNGATLSSISVTLTSGAFTLPGNYVRYGVVSSTGIGGFRFSGNAGGSTSIDNLNVVTSSGAVPEPASWAMLIAGFGLVGAAARRRRTVIAA